MDKELRKGIQALLHYVEKVDCFAQQLIMKCGLKQELYWLKQSHGYTQEASVDLSSN